MTMPEPIGGPEPRRRRDRVMILVLVTAVLEVGTLVAAQAVGVHPMDVLPTAIFALPLYVLQLWPQLDCELRRREWGAPLVEGGRARLLTIAAASAGLLAVIALQLSPALCRECTTRARVVSEAIHWLPMWLPLFVGGLLSWSRPFWLHAQGVVGPAGFLPWDSIRSWRFAGERKVEFRHTGWWPKTAMGPITEGRPELIALALRERLGPPA